MVQIVSVRLNTRTDLGHGTRDPVGDCDKQQVSGWAEEWVLWYT